MQFTDLPLHRHLLTPGSLGRMVRMPRPPQLATFDVEEKQLLSLLTKDGATHSVSHHPQLMVIRWRWESRWASKWKALLSCSALSQSITDPYSMWITPLLSLRLDPEILTPLHMWQLLLSLLHLRALASDLKVLAPICVLATTVQGLILNTHKAPETTKETALI